VNLSALAGIVGAENVQSGDECRHAASSWSPEWTKRNAARDADALPLAVVLPADTEQAAAIVRWANQTRIPLSSVGGGSSLVRGVRRAPWVAVDLSRLTEVEWDEESLLVRAGAGWNLATLEKTLNGHDYTLGQFPQSMGLATVGGCVATDAVGALAGKYGRFSDVAVGLTAVLPNGAILQTQRPPLGSAAPDLHALLLGGEGAFGIVTEARLRLRPAPEARAWAVFVFPSFGDGVDALRLIYRSDARPAGVRLLDTAAVGDLRSVAEIPARGALLLLCFEGDEIVQTGQYQLAFAICQQVCGIAQDSTIGDRWFETARTDTSWMAANARPSSVADGLALGAAWSTLKAVHGAVRAALSGMVTQQSAQIGSAGSEGASLDFRFEAEEATGDPLALHARIVGVALDAALAAGGAVAAHFGIGAARAPFLRRERGPVSMATVAAIQAALDPNGIFTPGWYL
jgi:alkyldihydroxyacetonephosphate synthase